LAQQTIYRTEYYLNTFEHFDDQEEVTLPDTNPFTPAYLGDAFLTDENIIIVESLVSHADCHTKIAAKLVEYYQMFAKAVLAAGKVWGLHPQDD
jgi:hypothetical protein